MSFSLKYRNWIDKIGIICKFKRERKGTYHSKFKRETLNIHNKLIELIGVSLKWFLPKI